MVRVAIGQRQLADTLLDLQSNPNRPDVLELERGFLSN
jgi:hypothetical protein